MALSKAQKAAKAQKAIDDARQALAIAEAAGAEAGIVTAPALGVETKRNTKTVWVGCKLPRGLVIQLFEEVTIDRPVFGGAIKPTKMFMRSGEQVRLKGYAIPFGKVPNYPIIGDYGLTEVDRQFWETWKEQNKKLDLVVSGLIFAHGEEASARAYAKEHEGLKCGLEPLEQKGDPRAEQPNSPNLTDIEVDNDRDRAA